MLWKTNVQSNFPGAYDNLQQPTVTWVSCFFIRSVQLVLNDGWQARIWIRDGQNQGRARHSRSTFGRTAGGSQGDSLPVVWSALTGLWLRQLGSTCTDERAREHSDGFFGALRRQGENDGGGNLQGNQWTETDECLQWHLLSIYELQGSCEPLENIMR